MRARETVAADEGNTHGSASETALDITAHRCPMTYVRTRLALDRLPRGAILAVRLAGQDPLLNVPRTAREQGHEVLSIETAADGTATVRIRKGG